MYLLDKRSESSRSDDRWNRNLTGWRSSRTAVRCSKRLQSGAIPRGSGPKHPWALGGGGSRRPAPRRGILPGYPHGEVSLFVRSLSPSRNDYLFNFSSVVCTAPRKYNRLDLRRTRGRLETGCRAAEWNTRFRFVGLSNHAIRKYYVGPEGCDCG